MLLKSVAPIFARTSSEDNLLDIEPYNLASFAEELSVFADPFVKYAQAINVDGVNFDLVEASANAALALATMATNLPNSGGVVSWFAGDNSLASFAEELNAFADPFVKYAQAINVDGVNFDLVEASANAASALSEMAKNLPNSGGVVSWFAGDNSLASFAEELSVFADPFVNYAKAINVDSVNLSLVETSANAATALSEMAKNLPNSGGFTSWLTGDNSLVSFAEELNAFAGPFVKYAQAINVDGVNFDLVEASANAASALSEMAKNLPNSGGADFSELTSFGNELVSFGPCIVQYAASVEGLKPSVVTNSANAAKVLFEMANNLPRKGGLLDWIAGEQSLTSFAEELVTFGPSLMDYSQSVEGLKQSVVQTSANAAKVLFEMAENLPAQGGFISWFTGEQSLTAFGEELASFGPSIKSYYESVKGIKAEVVNVSANSAKALAELANNLPTQGTLANWFGGQDLSVFGASLVSFGENFAKYSTFMENVNPEILDATTSAAFVLCRSDGTIVGTTHDALSIPYRTFWSDYSHTCRVIRFMSAKAYLGGSFRIVPT